jgi:ABC-2 type transport system permease protein
MRTVWIIARQFILLIARQKATLFWMLAAPCLYTFVFGYAFRYQNDPSKAKASLAVLNEDGGYLSARLIRSMRSENIDLDSLRNRPAEVPGRLLRIPPDFTLKVLGGDQVVLVLCKRPDANVEAEQTAVMGIRKAIFRLLADLSELSVRGKRADPKNLAALDGRDPLIRVQVSYAGNRRVIPSGFNQQVPANVVQFGLIFMLIYAGSSLFEERKQGLLRRIRIGPVGSGQLFAGKLLGATGVALIQSALLFLIGRLAFGVYNGDSLPALILIVLCFCACIASMGLCLGFAVKQHEKMVGIAILSALGMAAFSGCWWPLEVSPPWMQKAGLVLPSGLALRAFHLLISYGKGFGSVLPHCAGLAAYATAFALVFSRLLKKGSTD